MSTKKQKTTEDILNELWKIADEKGHGYVYHRPPGGCSYVNDNSSGPGCFIGHWLHGHGVGLATLESNEGSIADKWYETYQHLVDFTLTQQAVMVLTEVQGFQDDGCPWGEAIQAACVVHDVNID